MCALPPAWLWLLLGLLPLEIQSRAPPHGHSRLTLPRGPLNPKSSAPSTAAVPTVSNLAVAIDNHIPGGDGRFMWRVLLHRGPRLHPSVPLLDPSHDGLEEAPALRPRGSRGRRHANTGGGWGHGHGHSHLMRVGCVLGTCQVQNLSHRLYQLIGQSGREDSSPINPRSPHSFG